MFTKIDVSTWNRRMTYDVFTKEKGGCFSLTANVDITSFLLRVKQSKEKFFPKLLFAFSTILNRRTEFKMDRDEDGNVGYYDVIHPCSTLFHEKEEVITLLWTEFSNDQEEFLQNYNQGVADYGYKPFEQKELVKNIFHISCLPWISFSAVTLDMSDKYENFIPAFSIGKYFEQNGKTLLPVAIHVNHAILDGFHVARFFAELEQWLAEN